jgi:leucyl aminopeptidase (aminopeptidase T)
VFGDVSYRPPHQILERYADLLVNWALGGGQGISVGDVVLINAHEDAKPLMIEACRAVWSAGGHVIPRLLPADDADLSLERSFYELAGEDQLTFFPVKMMLAMIEPVDHILHITGERDPKALASVDPSKMMRRQQSYGPMIEAQNAKEGAGKLSWTIDRPIWHRGDGRRGRHDDRGVLGADHLRVLPRLRGSGGSLA